MKIPKLLFAPLLLMLAAWSCTTNPYKTAASATPDNRAETVALASYAMFVIVEETAADIKEMPGTPQNVKDALAEADRLTSPAAESLRDAATTIQGIRETIAAGGPGAESLPAKLEALNQLLTETAPKLKAFTDAVAAAKKGSP